MNRAAEANEKDYERARLSGEPEPTLKWDLRIAVTLLSIGLHEEKWNFVAQGIDHLMRVEESIGDSDTQVIKLAGRSGDSMVFDLDRP